IERAFARVISDKAQTTILPIISSQVLPYSTIMTDEHRSYSRLNKNSYEHKTVCHKYNFVDKITGAHTQSVESFNGQIKNEIKKQKGVLTAYRPNFLKDFCLFYNNRENYQYIIFDLIKV
ncbi:hypothetical protein DMUE_2403, partial [Dictyocoela muelleri]